MCNVNYANYETNNNYVNYETLYKIISILYRI